MDLESTLTDSETTTVWEFLFPEVKKETQKASESVREDLTGFLDSFAKKLNELYQAIDQNPVRTWGADMVAVGLKFPFVTERTSNEFFEGFDDPIIHPIRMLTEFIRYVDEKEIEVEQVFYRPLSVFGERGEDRLEKTQTECGIERGDLEDMIADLMPTLSTLATFLTEIFAVGQRFVEYLVYLYSPFNPFFEGFFHSVPLVEAFSAIGRLLRMIYIIQTLVNDNIALSEGWDNFRHMIVAIKKSPQQYSTDASQVQVVEQSVVQIHQLVFSGKLIEFFIEAVTPVCRREGGGGEHFGLQVERFICETIPMYLKNLSKGEFAGREAIVCDITLLSYLVKVACGKILPKTVSLVWSTHQVAPLVKLYHFVAFSPYSYLGEKMPDAIARALDKATMRSAQENLIKFMKTSNASLPAQVARVFNEFCAWQIRCQDQLERGVRLAFSIKAIVENTLDLHAAFGKQPSQEVSENIGRLICLTKAVEVTNILHEAEIAHVIPHAVDFYCKPLDEELKNVASQMRARQYKPCRTQISNIVSLAYHCIKFFSSPLSLDCLGVILDIFLSKALQGLSFTRQKLGLHLITIRQLSNYATEIDRACDCSYLVDNKDQIIRCLQAIASEPRRIVFLARAINDIARIVTGQVYLNMEKYFMKSIRTHFIMPNITKIEHELRYHSHEHLDVSERNPLKKHFSSFDNFLQIQPFRVLGRVVDIAYETTYYLSRLFYNETTVAPQVWEKYTEMATLATRIYNLPILDCHVHGAMLQQDTDLLGIAYNLPIFVSTYNYDLNSQVFIQKSEDSHYVTIVGVQHIFSSFRIHGIGIKNTTLDLLYKFLKSKMEVFCGFMGHEHLRDKMIHDRNYYETNKKQCGRLFPYDLAEECIVLERTKPAIEALRQAITQIGNAIGLVRMVKSGATRFLNNSIGFVYDEDADLSFKEFASEGKLSESGVVAVSRLDDIVTSVKEKFVEKSNAVKHFVHVFKSVLRNKSEHGELTHFAFYIPALSLNYIAYVSTLKDQAAKTNKSGSFSDDGFPMGVAYILKLLGQDRLFDSIRWFQSVRTHSEKQRQDILNSQKTVSWFDNAKKQSDKLLLYSNEKKQAEFNLFETTIHSARILFN